METNELTQSRSYQRAGAVCPRFCFMMVLGEPDAKLSRSPVPCRLFNVDGLACRTSGETNATI